MESFNAWIKGRPVPPLLWARHGPLPVLLDLPFLKLGKMYANPDFVLSFQPILLTAGIVTLVFLWLRKLASPGVSLAIALIAAFGTMLWPYAYIGIETKQSFFLLLAGYLGLANGKITTRLGLVGFALACALALGVKSVGVILFPAIAYLIYVQFRDDWRESYLRLLAVLCIIGGIVTGSIIGRNFYWRPFGGGAVNLQNWMIETLFQYPANVFGLFGSPSKGLFLFAPILVLSIWAVPRLFHTRRDLAMFAGLATACTVAFLAILISPYDETWGPRFMHGTIAPLLVCIGAAWPRMTWRFGSVLTVLGALGVGVSFLGAFFFYGQRAQVAEAAGQNTMEWLTGDNVWNEVFMDAQMFRVWLKGGDVPALFSAKHIWAWTAPPGAAPWKEVDLRSFAQPQSVLFYHAGKERTTHTETLRRFYIACFPVGFALLSAALWTGLRHGESKSRSGPRLAIKLTIGGLAVAGLASAAVWIAMPNRLQPVLSLNKSVVSAGSDSYALSIPQLPGAAVLLRYSFDGGPMEQMRFVLDNDGRIEFKVGPETKRGTYRFLDFKEENSLYWLATGAVVTVK